MSGTEKDNVNEQAQHQGVQPLLDTAGDGLARDGYHYGANGIGVRADLVQAIIDVWSRISPTGGTAEICGKRATERS